MGAERCASKGCRCGKGVEVIEVVEGFLVCQDFTERSLQKRDFLQANYRGGRAISSKFR
jgi:2-keto-4-pentenoate hydratase/2-oxohepta-3-ene-1,7-dioic acid hydratase in catechol pathway